MTDDRAEQLARAMIGLNVDEVSDDAIDLARRALAAVDADPETYGYVRLVHTERTRGTYTDADAGEVLT